MLFINYPIEVIIRRKRIAESPPHSFLGMFICYLGLVKTKKISQTHIKGALVKKIIE